jgi:Tol biopolymer transport system component
MKSILRRPAVLLALALCSVGGVVTLLGRLASGPKVDEKRVTLAGEPGTKSYPAFSPDGQRIAYSLRVKEGDAFHVFIRAVPADSPRQLTSGAASDVSPVWSPDGNRIAFLRMEDGHADYMVAPAGGGAERKVVEFADDREDDQPAPAVAWTSDGKSLVVVDPSQAPAALSLVPVDGGPPVRITKPPEGAEGDSTPLVSPDGATLAFVRKVDPNGGDIYLCDLHGQGVRRLTFDDARTRGISWLPSGQDLVFASTRGAGSELWRLAAYGGSPHMFAMAGTNATYPAVAPLGNRIAYADSPSVTSIWRARLGGDEDSVDEQEMVRSSGRQSWPAYSPDGTKIAYVSDDSGTEEIWVCDTNGANRRQVSHFNGPRVRRPRWSPDGKTLLVSSDEQGQGLYTVSVEGGGSPHPLVRPATNGSWSHDGKSVYFDNSAQIWRTSVAGGEAKAVSTYKGINQGVESQDGKSVYYRRGRSIWSVPVGGGEAEEVFAPEHDMPFTTLQPAKNGIYYLEWERGGRRMAVSFYDFERKESTVLFRIKGGNFDFFSMTFSVSPDGKSVVYPRVDRSETNLMLVENFR